MGTFEGLDANLTSLKKHFKKKLKKATPPLEYIVEFVAPGMLSSKMWNCCYSDSGDEKPVARGTLAPIPNPFKTRLPSGPQEEELLMLAATAFSLKVSSRKANSKHR